MSVFYRKVRRSLYWMLFPKGAKAKAAILKCCMPKGMPMIVIHSKRPNPRCVRQIQKPDEYPDNVHDK